MSVYFAPLRFRDVPGLLFRAIDWRLVGTFVLGAIVGVVAIFMLSGCSSATFQVEEAINVEDSDGATSAEANADTGGGDGVSPRVDVEDAREASPDDSRDEGGADAPLETSADAAGSDSHDGADAKDSDLAPDACASVHENGFGHPFAFCASTGKPGIPSTYSSSMAKAASSVQALGITGRSEGSIVCDGATLPTVRTDFQCFAWAWSGPSSGHASASSSTSCVCPSVSDVEWN